VLAWIVVEAAEPPLLRARVRVTLAKLVLVSCVVEEDVEEDAKDCEAVTAERLLLVWNVLCETAFACCASAAF
jgi:hypothetical protein